MLSRLAVIPIALASLLAAPTGALPGAGVLTEQLVVGFHEAPALARGDAYLDGRVVDLDEALRFAVVETRDPSGFEARARADDAVRYVERNDPEFGRALLVPNDARYNDAGHYGSKRIGAEKAWDRTTGSSGVKVAVIDSGLRRTHEEFAGQVRILQGWDAISEDNDPQDTCGHGTHVTGTIAATINNAKGIAGLAQASVYPIRGLTANLILCSGSTADLAQGLRLAADQGAHLSSNSWGGGSASSVTDAISYAHSKGTVVVAAAGNDGSCANCVSEPWRSNGAKVIIVSSTTSSDGFSSFSSQGPEVDVSAPGSDVLSAYTSSDSSYTTMSGTSMATPHVTGTAALLKTLNPSWGFAEIDGRLKATAVDLGAAGRDDRFGHGRIDADAATAGGSPPPGNGPPTAAYAFTTSGLTVSVDGGGSADGDGTVVSWSWSWGDGTPAGSGPTASHSYAAAGTYAVTLTVTDDDGATDAETKSVTVANPGDPDPGATTLANGAALSDASGAAGTSKHYKIQVPSGRSSLSVVLDGPACGLLNCPADLDLYVRRGARPTDALYDCRPYEGDADESCTLAAPAADWWYVRVHVYSGSNGAYTIRATYS